MVKKSKKKTSSAADLSSDILKKFQKHPTQAYNYKQLSRLLKIKQPPLQKLVNSTLIQLASQGKLKEVHRGKYKLKQTEIELIGKVDMTSNGSAFIVSPDSDQDIFVPSRSLHNAMHGDTVAVSVQPTKKGKRPEGIITKVIERKKQVIVGVLEVAQNHAFLIPDEFKLQVDVYVSKDKLNGAMDGQKVIVRLLDWPEGAKNPFGEVIEILGMPGEHQTEMHSIIAEYELPVKFPEAVIKESEAIADSIAAEEIKRRRDMRKIVTFTIDPDDAKDFDDALSYEILDENTLQIGVHIADVTHYVKEGTELDKEAFKRATSVYLVDRVIPMLPEKLSNEICSLRPKEDKLCFSVIFTMNTKGDILNRWFGKTVINSNHRFTYDQIQSILEKPEGEYAAVALELNRIAKYHRALRFKNGAINFDKVEVKFQLDDKGNPLNVIIKESKDAHKLIEEFMLLANKYVAEYGGRGEDQKTIRPFVYRVHDSPDPEKMKVFNEFISQFGYSIQTSSHKEISKSFNTLLKEVKGKGEENIIEQLAIRTMSKAIYTSKNIGHYGLAFKHYSHFTSPIRRYPDMMVHRLLEKYLDHQNPGANTELEARCLHCSEMEKRATEAERASIKYKQVEFLKDKVGVVYNGIISGVSEWGIYVEIIENKCEGMVRMRDMKDDYYYFDEKKYAAVGKRYGSIYHLGDEVFVRIKKADLVKKQLDFELIES